MLKRLFVLLAAMFICWSAQGESSAQAESREITVENIQRELLSRTWSILDREDVQQREARAAVMAKALYDAVHEINPQMSKRWLVAAAISIWWYETRFSSEVHRGGLSRWGSDKGKAKCFGQLHERGVGISQEPGESLEDFRARQKATWESLTGTDEESTKQCALATMRAYRSKLSMCQDSENMWVSAYGAYGSGNSSCEPLPTSEHRHLLAKRMAPRL